LAKFETNYAWEVKLAAGQAEIFYASSLNIVYKMASKGYKRACHFFYSNI
jgi:hypothetical protein